MPVRHGDLSDYGPEPKRCKHCDESSGSCGGSAAGPGAGAAPGAAAGGEGSWRVTLDHDLVETLSAIYPEWFKPQQHRRGAAPPADCDEPRTPATPLTPYAPLTPNTPHTPHTPRSDDTRSSGCSDMAASGSGSSAGESGGGARSPPPQLSPPRVSPPKAVVDASPLQQAMDRNKESLKMKLMMRRPYNQLVAQGIMPPLKTPPAYHEQRIHLERAKTGDLLKAKIQRRPDRQELERRHILELQEGHVDPSLAEKQRMLKKARLADALNDQLSHRPGPLELIKKNILHTEEPIEDAVKRDLVTFRATSEGASLRPTHPSAYFVPPDDHSPSPSPPSTLSPASVASPPLLHPAPGKDKNRKSKSKLKQAPKARPIKFHEYKGPPSAQKASTPPSGAAGAEETSYELLLQQQQLFLQLMLSAAPAHSPVASPAASDCSDAHAPPPPPPPPPPFAPRIEEMKVTELRAECKRHNLRVSGPKPQLIDRLRPYLSEESPRSPASSGASPPRAESAEREPPPSEEAAHAQPRQVEELQRELEAVLREAASVAAAGDQQQGKRLLQAKIYVSRLRAQLEALQQPPPPPPPPPPPRYILAAPEPSPDRLVRLIAVPPQCSDASDGEVKPSQTYILNGVKVVPIAILPSHYEPQRLQATIQPPPPPPPPPASEPSHHLADDMDDVLEILVENGELPRSAVGADEDFLADAFSPDAGLHDNILGRGRLESDALQRQLDDIQNEILQHADRPAPPADDLAVDLLSDDGFATDFSGRRGDSTDLFGSFLRGESQRELDEPMDINECARDGLDCDEGDVFADISELSFPSDAFGSHETRLQHDGLDLKEFGIDLDCDASMGAPAGDPCGYMELDAPPNLFGRGHQPQCDPLLGGVPARPNHLLYSWDQIDYDGT